MVKDPSKMHIRITMVTREQSDSLREWLLKQFVRPKRSQMHRRDRIDGSSSLESYNSTPSTNDSKSTSDGNIPYRINKRPKDDVEDDQNEEIVVLDGDGDGDDPRWKYYESEFGSPFSFAIIRCESEQQRKEVMQTLRKKAEKEKDRHWDFVESCSSEYIPQRIEEKFILLQHDGKDISLIPPMSSIGSQSLPLFAERKDIDVTKGAAKPVADQALAIDSHQMQDSSHHLNL